MMTIFTPTYNRINTLPRVYKSLLNQSDKNFIWLIVDDGSTDGTKNLISEWIKDARLKIRYYFKDNGGKHTAMKLAYEQADTKYFLAIDSDDELTPDAVKIFYEEWERIIDSGDENNFAEVSALTYSVDGNLIGNFIFPEGTDYIDSYWHEMVLKYKNNNENVVCWDLGKLKECVIIPDKFWLSDRVNLFGEFVLWARIGRKYKTRYINRQLRIYHFDTSNSILRNNDSTISHYNNLVEQKFFLDENLDFFFWNPRYFFNLTLKFIISGIELRRSCLELLKVTETTKLRLAYIIFLPIGFLAFVYFKHIKRRFWF